MNWNRVVLSSLAVLTLTGCGANTDENTDTESKTEEVATTESEFNENVTGGTEVAALDADELMITDTDGDNILDPAADETEQSIENSGFEYTVKVFDTDGDGVVSDENDQKEKFTTVIKLKNTSGHDIEVNDLQIYLQSAEDETINLEYIDTQSMDESKFVVGAEHYEDYIQYKDEETYDTFTFPAGEELTFVTTQEVTVATSDINPAKLMFTATKEDGTAYYVESSTAFAAE